MIGHLDVTRPLVLKLPKMSGYVKTFKEKNNKFMCVCINDDKLLEKYKTIWTQNEDSENTELNALPVYDDRYKKTKITTYSDKTYTNFCGLNMSEDGVECKFFAIIFLILYLFMSAFKIVNTQMIDYLYNNLFASDKN